MGVTLHINTLALINGIVLVYIIIDIQIILTERITLMYGGH